MPLNAIGWSTEEDEKLVDLVQPHAFLYNQQDPSRKSILTRETTWQEIAQAIGKPVEECKKRWRGLRDSYMRCKRVGSIHKTKTSIIRKLEQFLDEVTEGEPLFESVMEEVEDHEGMAAPSVIGTEQVITDNQEYYEITVVDGPEQNDIKPFIKIVQKPQNEEPPKKIMKKVGRKKSTPLPRNIPPVKILPKPIVMSNIRSINNIAGPKIVGYMEEQKSPEQRSQVIDKLIEKILKENTNEIDVFFRSMAASVKKLQPNLIPKVKMEVCNVIAKYEMQSFERQ
ncbi:hypothetical protein O0L34_g11787 [Tuta absoluta]|nr:hypothetical protein O0L34_g11787 [Tuta absoluta]